MEIMGKNKIIIIAEAGVNHNGDIALAKELIDVAEEAGADFVKFQTAKLSSLVTGSAPMAEYQAQNIGREESQKSMLEKLLLSYESFRELHAYCQGKKVQFLSTPFDLESIAFLLELEMPFWKIPSGEITNYPYLAVIGKTKKPVVLSTGMAEMEEIKEAMDLLRMNGCEEIIVLHCHTDYPTSMEYVNLRAMESLRKDLGVAVGYSDHTIGIEVPIAAAACGAVVIEKHFTLDKNMEGPDHKCSLEPQELKEMVRCIRNIELAMGDGRKTPSESELRNRCAARKSIVCSCSVAKGERFTEENITTKRPGTGISPMEWTRVIGKKSNRDYQFDELVDGCILDE